MNGNQYMKNSTLVQFPLEGLDMKTYVPEVDTIDGKPVIYDCFGVVNHMGGTGGGHYTAFCKHPKRKEWCVYDDARWQGSLNPAQVQTDSAYVVFYKIRDS